MLDLFSHSQLLSLSLSLPLLPFEPLNFNINAGRLVYMPENDAREREREAGIQRGQFFLPRETSLAIENIGFFQYHQYSSLL